MGIFILGVIASLLATFIYNFLSGEAVQKQSPASQNVSIQKIEKVEEKQAPQKRNKFLVQSYSTIEIYDGDLTITLNDMVEYSNQKIHLVVSKIGKPQRNFEKLSLGDKVLYEGYEISFIDTKNNINTEDVLLKVVPLNNKT